MYTHFIRPLKDPRTSLSFTLNARHFGTCRCIINRKMLIKDQFVRTRGQDNAHKSKQRLPNGQRRWQSAENVGSREMGSTIHPLHFQGQRICSLERPKEAIREEAKDLRALRVCEPPEVTEIYGLWKGQRRLHLSETHSICHRRDKWLIFVTDCVHFNFLHFIPSLRSFNCRLPIMYVLLS